MMSTCMGPALQLCLKEALWDLLHTEPSSSCPLLKCHLPPPAQTSHLIMEPFLFPQILEGSCCTEPCVQACPGGIYMSLGKEVMSHLCQCLSTLTSRKFILVSDPNLYQCSAAEAVCSLSSTELGSCPQAHSLVSSLLVVWPRWGHSVTSL